MTLLLSFSYAQAQWQENGVPVSTVTGDEEHPEIISDGAGGSIIVWQTYRHPNNYPHIYAQRLDEEGYPLWATGGISVCTAANSQHKPQIVTDGVGGAIIAWRDFRNGNADIYAQRIDPDGDPLWEVDGIAVCTVQDTFGWWLESQISMIPISDGVIIAWYDKRTGTFSIYAQRIDTSGTIMWTPDGIAVCSEAGGQIEPVLVTDGAEGAIAVWIDWRGTDDDLYAQRIGPDSTLLWSAGGVPVCVATGNQTFHRAVSDDMGGMLCTWIDARGGSDEEADAYSQRIDGDGLALWTTDGIPLCAEAKSQYWSCVAADGRGGAFYAWADRRNALWYEQEIYAQRVSPEGTFLWGSGGILIREPGLQYDNGKPEIIPDGVGGVLIAIFTVPPLARSMRAAPSLSAYDDIDAIFMQRVAGDGTVLWQESGVYLCNFPNWNIGPRYPRMLPDGTGGAVVTWYNQYEFNGIYAQRINGSGYSPPTDDRIPLPSLGLMQNFPNPFNPVTRVKFSLKEKGHVRLRVYDVSGRLVRVLVDEVREAGAHNVLWDGTNDEGRSTASGIYFCRMEAADYERTLKMVMLR